MVGIKDTIFDVFIKNSYRYSGMKYYIKMKNTKTLDEKHSEMVAQFSKNREEILPKLEKETELLKNKLKKGKKNIDDYMETKDAILKNKKKIRVLKEDEKKYY